MKNIKNTLCLLSLVLCAASVIAEDQTSRKTATPEEVISCGKKLTLVKALQYANLQWWPITGSLATMLVGRATYQQLAWLPKAVAFSCALTNGLLIFPAVTLAPFFLEQYVENKYDKTFDKESRDLIWEYTNGRYDKCAFLGMMIAYLTSLVSLSVQ